MIFSLVSVPFWSRLVHVHPYYLFSSEDIPRKLKRATRDALWHFPGLCISIKYLSRSIVCITITTPFVMYIELLWLNDNSTFQKIIFQLRCTINFPRAKYLKRSGHCSSGPFNSFILFFCHRAIFNFTLGRANLSIEDRRTYLYTHTRMRRWFGR